MVGSWHKRAEHSSKCAPNFRILLQQNFLNSAFSGTERYRIIGYSAFSHLIYTHINSSSCSWRIRRVYFSLISKMKLVPLFLPRSSYVPSSFGLYCSACFGILFVSILCSCCSHFSWYCFISFTTFCVPVSSLIHWFFCLTYLNHPYKDEI